MPHSDTGTTTSYPSTDLAYEFVRPAYDWAIQRSDRVEARVQVGIAGISALTLAMPTLGKALVPVLEASSPWFGLALIAYGCALVLGIRAQTGGLLRLVDPTVLYEKWLRKDPETFKLGMIQFAGEDLGDNIDLINARHKAMMGMYKLAALETAFWVLWIVTG
jgi:hypothetical protein